MQPSLKRLVSRTPPPSLSFSPNNQVNSSLKPKTSSTSKLITTFNNLSCLSKVLPTGSLALVDPSCTSLLLLIQIPADCPLLLLFRICCPIPLKLCVLFSFLASILSSSTELIPFLAGTCLSVHLP